MFDWILLLVIAPSVLLVLALFVSKDATRSPHMRALEDVEQRAALRAARRSAPGRGVFATHDGH